MIASAALASFCLLVIAVSCVGPTVGLVGPAGESGPGGEAQKGTLRDCPGSPNCVCSERNPGGDAYIAPFAIADGVEPSAAFDRLASIIEADARIETRRADYFHAVFTSRLLRFRDDFEARLASEDRLIHVRSASRLGSSDFGVNRKRIERLRILFQSGASRSGR